MKGLRRRRRRRAVQCRSSPGARTAWPATRWSGKFHPDDDVEAVGLGAVVDEIRRNHPERFKKDVEPVWEAQRGSWVAPLEADELMNAFVARGEALDQVRMHFADLDPQTAVPYVVMKAIDPQLLKAALHPGEAARWTKPLNDRYEVIRRNHDCR